MASVVSPASPTPVQPASSRTRRRRQRSARVSVAVVLLAVAVVSVAVAVPTGRLVALAAVVAAVCGVAATRIVATELAQSRRDAAHERAEQAQAYQRLMARRSEENTRFATAMTARLTDREAAIGRLREALKKALRRADTADERAQVEAARAGTLAREVARLREQLDDEAALVDPGTPTVVDLVAWAQRSADAAAESAEDWRVRA